ncbi:hypothetical protein PLICRDRAFT_608451 [Plicaturopsis crispa FD-325 SS-3]|nr:hypothetical protein PLICRDRAFT_608451 [Plicaturopsis crispa FD-325 SS-3]
MELCLRDNDPTQTLLITPDGRPLYKIETPGQRAVTIVRRLEHNAAESIGRVACEIGKIEPAVRGARLCLCEANTELHIGPEGNGQVEQSWAFRGPDGRPYKWQIFIQYPVLLLDDNSQTPIARYKRAKLGIISRSRRASLEVLPAGINIIDLIVVTFVSFVRQYMPPMDLDTDNHIST